VEAKFISPPSYQQTGILINTAVRISNPLEV